jgi:phosphoribosyl 1,2-cyclic phosphodiesterase
MPIRGDDVLGVAFHGVRGSTPCHGEDTRRYGGNTSCVSIDAPGEQPLLLDLGTGLRYAAASLGAGPFRGTALLTHLHWDHVQGLPFFTPILQPDAELDIFGPGQGGGGTVAKALAQLITPPAFPVPLFDLPGDIRVHDVEDVTFRIGGFSITSRLIPHNGPTCGFRVEWGGRSVVYIPDHQQPDDPLAVADSVRELCAGADLLIHDAQYTPHEFAQKQTWGHCTVEYAVSVAAQCKVGRLALFHHDPGHDDCTLDELELLAARCAQGFGVEVFSAKEGDAVAV